MAEQEKPTTRREQFMRLYEPLRPKLSRFAMAMTNDREEARDLVAETTLQAYEGFDSVRDHTAFLSWLFTIASRIYKKRSLRERWYDDYDEEHARRMPDSGTSPDASADVALLYKALSRLPDEQREAVILFEISDLPLKEIARIQGSTLSGVKSRVTRGRKRLAKLLGVPDAEEEGPERTVDTANSTAQDNGKILYMNAA